MAALAPGDVLLYDITCVARDECSVVRSFGMRLPADKLGTATAPGNRLVFVRLPLLFAHELQHDLDHIFPSYPKAIAEPRTRTLKGRRRFEADSPLSHIFAQKHRSTK